MAVLITGGIEEACRASQVALSIKNWPTSAGDGRDKGPIPGGEHGDPLQDSCPENPMDRGVWRATVHRGAKTWSQLKRLSAQTEEASTDVDKKPAILLTSCGHLIPGTEANANKDKTLLFTSRSWEENEEMYRNIVLLLEKWLRICDLMTVIIIRNSSYVKIISRHPSTVPHLSQTLTIQFHLIY